MKTGMAITGLLAALMLATPANGQGNCSADNPELTQTDRERLGGIGMSRLRGLGSALRGEAADRGIVAALYEDGLDVPLPETLPGRYECRTIKLGGLLDLTVYQWFGCEIGREDAVYTIRKITGSQNFFGTLTPGAGGVTYRGAQHYGYEDSIRHYGDDPERDQVGCLSALPGESRHFILELPFPQTESVHDIIELRPLP